MTETSNNQREHALIMIVDDDDTTRMIGQRRLSQSGFAVLEANDGLQALALTKTATPDLILLDVDMPRLDGFSTCEQLRRDAQFRNVPIVMMTATENQESIDRAFSVGATDFASKPVNWSILGHRIRYMLRSAETLGELANAQRLAKLGSWSLEGTECSWSDQLFQMLGYEPGAQTTSIDSILALMTDPDHDLVQHYIDSANPKSGEFSLVHSISRADHKPCIVDHRIRVTSGADPKSHHIAGTMQDITEREQAASRIRRLAYFDGLTDLPNRESFQLQLDTAVATAKRHSRHLAVLYLDLDDFKKINDTLGHSVGDELLQVVGRRLQEGLRKEDSITRAPQDSNSPARLGGDEFAVLLGEIAHPDDAALVAERLLASLSSSIELTNHEVYVTPSIGIAIYPNDGETPETLLQHADVAMYQAKLAGKNLYRYFHADMNKVAKRRLDLDQYMRRALERSEFYLTYQPKIDAISSRIDGAEALIRWHSKELGLVSPFEFIPISEENGMILSIGDWVLKNACYQTKKWREQGIALPRISVNISALQFMQANFVARVEEILQECQLEPETLDLEITESLLASDAKAAVRTLSALKSLGVELSIDDFGTGYSSLSHLKQFPIDRLKIDRSFIHDLENDINDSTIVSAILGLAAGMNLQVTAEGVETIEQAVLLRDSGCQQLQGYLYSKPVTADEFAQLFLGYCANQHRAVSHLSDYRTA